MVSRLKMGEMEEVDLDHITTDIQSQKVKIVSQRGRAKAGVSML